MTLLLDMPDDRARRSSPMPARPGGTSAPRYGDHPAEEGGIDLADPQYQAGREIFGHIQADAAATILTQLPVGEAARILNGADKAMDEPRAVAVLVRLVVISGPRAREAFDLGPGELIIGREEGSAIWLWDPKVSHHHALLRRQGDQVVIEDLRSTNGTMVNGAGISVPTTLAPGDVITVGDVQLRLESGPASSESG